MDWVGGRKAGEWEKRILTLYIRCSAAWVVKPLTESEESGLWWDGPHDM